MSVVNSAILFILRLRVITDFTEVRDRTVTILLFDKLRSFKPRSDIPAKDASSMQFLFRSSFVREWH